MEPDQAARDTILGEIGAACSSSAVDTSPGASGTHASASSIWFEIGSCEHRCGIGAALTVTEKHVYEFIRTLEERDLAKACVFHGFGSDGG